MLTPRSSYEHGQRFAYDDPDDEQLTQPAEDWAHRAARGVLADLRDRRDIKRGFANIDWETRCEIVDSLAEIIRIARGESD